MSAASSIKATLQAESASLSTRLQAEQSARGAAERRAEAAANEVARFNEVVLKKERAWIWE